MSVNEVTLIGNLGDIPEIRVMTSGSSVANFSVATSEKWRDKQTGEQREKTEWTNCKAFDRGNYLIAQYIAQGCQKGTKIYVKGKLETEEYEKDGIKRYATKVNVVDFEILANGIPKDQQGQQPAPQQGGFNQPAQQAPKPQPQSFGSFGAAPVASAPEATWENVEPAGEPAQKGATIDQIKAHEQVGGDINKAIALGWVADSSIPF